MRLQGTEGVLMAKKCFVMALFLMLPVLYGYGGGSELARGSIAGRVYDRSTGEALTGANVVIVGSRVGAVTDGEGRFTIERISPGTYDIEVSLIGYARVTKSAISVQPDRATSAEFALERVAIEMREVQVSASPFVKSPEAPVSAISLAGSEIRLLAGGLQDPVRAFSVLPGVARTKIDRNDLLVRGGGASENLLVVDDLELPYFNHFGTQGASGGSLSFINMEFVDRASFSSGGFGVRYGDRLSSVSNLNLAEGNRSRFVGKVTLSATQLGLNLEGPLGEASSFLASARRSYLDVVFRAYGFSFAPRFWDYLGKLTIRVGNRDKLTLLAIRSDDTFALWNSTEDQRYENSRLLFTDQTHNIGGIRWSHFFEAGQFSLTYEATQSEFDDRQRDVYLNDVFKSRSCEFGSSLRADMIALLSSSTELGMGMETSYMQFSSSVDFQRPVSMYGEQVAPVRAEFDTAAIGAVAYVQLSQLLGAARVTFGARATRFNLTGHHWFLAPRFSASVPLTDRLSFSASAGQYYQAPSHVWLVATPFNRSLGPMSARHIVVGGEYLAQKSLRISIEAYQKRYSHSPVSLSRPYLAMANTGVGLGASLDGAASYGIDSLVSAGSGGSRGVEVLLQKKALDSPWYGMLSVTYASTDFVPLDGRARPSSYDQRWIMNIAVGYRVHETWNLGAAWHYYSGRPYTPFGADIQDRYNSERLPANHSLDVSISRDWALGTWTLNSFLNIQNLYNRKPYEAPIFSEKRQRAEQPPTLGIVPSIGISLATR